MKKQLLIIFLIASVATTFSQKIDSTKKTLDCYVSLSASAPTSDNFKQNGYPSFEFGISCKNMMFGINTGRMSFDKSPYVGENIKNYYSEIKMMTMFPIGPIKGYVLGGIGEYYESTHMFIEYGGGIDYSVGKFDLTLQVSNWNQIVYLSPGITYNFSIKR